MWLGAVALASHYLGCLSGGVVRGESLRVQEDVSGPSELPKITVVAAFVWVRASHGRSTVRAGHLLAARALL